MIASFDFPIEIVRTARRKTAKISLENSVVKVRVPSDLSEMRISNLVSKKSSWIKQQILEIQLTESAKLKEYVSGETFSYLGRNYRLKVRSGQTASVKLVAGYFQVVVPNSEIDESDETIKALLKDWYVKQSKKRLREKVKRFSKQIGVEPVSINVREYKSRWGSCSPSGDVTFNWRIMMAPNNAVDYIVVHELCHLIEHNHSPRFWKLVAQIISDHKDIRRWLKMNSTSLTL